MTRNTKRRVGKPHRAIGLTNDVIGRIQRLTLKLIGHDSDAAVVLGTCDAAPAMLTGQQTPFCITRHAIGEIRWRTEYTPSARGFVVAHDAVIGNVADQQITPIAKPDRPFCPAHAAAQHLHRAAEYAVLHEGIMQDFDPRVWVASVGRKIKHGTRYSVGNHGTLF